MTTIADLHIRAGNPDFSHWRSKKIYTLTQAVLRVCAIEPLEYDGLSDWELKKSLKDTKPVNWQHAYMMLEALTEALCTFEIKSPYIFIERPYNEAHKIEQIEISFEDINFIILAETRITRDELYKWLGKQGYLEPSKMVHKEFMKQTIYMEKRAQPIPISSYSTPAIQCLEAVIKEFWRDFDPQGNQPPPKQDTITKWIEDHHPEITAAQIRVAIDKICRHPSAKTGGNKPRNFKDITPEK